MVSPTVNKDHALERFIAVTQVPGRSREEADVAKLIEETLIAAGLDASNICYDGADQRTEPTGNCGNLIAKLPGNGKGPHTLLSAHMDTVPICVGAKPIVEGDEVKSRIETGLGADDRAGCTAILTAAIERLAAGDEHFAPATILFTVQEEIGLHGARTLDMSKIGKVDRAFNFDGGTVEKLTIGAIGGQRMTIELTGIPSHAGVAPEKGASAIIMAANAIADLNERGWLGKVTQAQGVGTANIGIFQGGDATNVITPKVFLRAEARSHDAKMRLQIVDEIRAAFEKAAAAVTNVDGESGACDFHSTIDYEAFRLPDDHPSIAGAKKVLVDLGREPFTEIGNGGLDANWLFQHGIQAVTLGCGQRNIHTADERLHIPDFLAACQVATTLITQGNQA